MPKLATETTTIDDPNKVLRKTRKREASKYGLTEPFHPRRTLFNLRRVASIWDLKRDA
jgi:hypothetical protein